MRELTSVHIITMHREASLAKIIPHLAGFGEVLVWDNGGTVEPNPAFELIQPGENKGIAVPRAEMKKRTKLPYILWLDDDVEIQDDGWFDTLVSFLSEPIGCIGSSGSYIDWRANHPFVPAPVGLCDVVSGWLLFYRNLADLEIDTTFNRWEEDSHLCMEMQDKGFYVMNCGYIGVIHVPGNMNPKLADREETLAHFINKWSGKGLTRIEGGY